VAELGLADLDLGSVFVFLGCMAATAWTDSALCSVPRAASAAADASAFSAAAIATVLSAASIGLAGAAGGGTGPGTETSAIVSAILPT
jgi:hypothetical protein